MGCDIHCYLERREGGIVLYPSDPAEDLGRIGAVCAEILDGVIDTSPPVELHGEMVVGDWVLVEELEVKRDYGLFTFLAGVRDVPGIFTISAPRDLPDDMSEGSKEQWGHWKGDGHSMSFLGLSEISAHGDKIVRGAPARESFGAFYAMLDEAATDWANHRIVFWFDN